jgi:serine/threonine-protein kinase
VAEAALAQPAEARAAFLDRVCGDDTGLRAEIEAQVQACEQAAHSATFLAGSAALFAAPLLDGLTGGEDLRNPGPTTAGEEERATAQAAQAERRKSLEVALRAALAGHYDVERELGRGGAATVYLARDRRHSRSVAIKVFDPPNGATTSTERFQREIRVTASLMHPHILPLHDSAEAAGLLYYVMPYVDGETLRERLARERPLELDAALRIVREMASALDCAHRHGVVHRDIKPANVLLADGHAVVADFGIARALHRAREPEQPGAVPHADGGQSDSLTEGGTSPGTPAYMAPEQVRGGADVDHRADLYALGVVAYEMLAGVHPFGARGPREMLGAHLGEAPLPLAARRPDTPPALAALVMQCLEKDPVRRPQSAAEIVAMLEGTRPAAELAGSEPPRRRAMWKVAAYAGAAIALLAVGGVVLEIGARTTPRAAGTPSALASETRRPVAIRTVAVLPFVNTGGAATDDYLSDGLTDELAYALTRLPGLQVAGRTSSYTFKGKPAAAEDIGRKLDVGAVVTGTLQRAGDRLRVTTQLVSTADGKVLWDSVYESHTRDVFAVQDELTRSIVAALAPALTVHRAGSSAMDVRRGTADQEAYDLYLKGRYYWLQRGAANIVRSIAYFKQAIARDSMFARAHAGLALSYSLLPVFLADSTDSATALTVASAQRAVALDSTLADAQLALAISLEMRLRLHDALAHYRAAVVLDPSSVTAHHWLGLCLLDLGRTDEALRELLRATQLDPLATSPASAAATALLYARRFPEAAVASRRALALDSTFAFATWTLGLAQAFGGQPDSAVLTLERGTRVNPGDPRLRSALLFAYAAAGRWADAEQVRAQLRRVGGKRSDGTESAFAALVFGESEPLVHVLTTPVGQRRYIASGGAIGCNPLFDPLWSDARFRTAMRALTVEACPLARRWPVQARPGA